MRNNNSRPKPAKKIARGKRRWYFRLRRANRKAVLGLINTFGTIWKFSENGRMSDTRTIKLAKLSKLCFFPLDVDIDRSNFDMLGALDVFILSKWLENGTIRFDREFQSLWRICAFDSPMVRTCDIDEISVFHHLCLERDPDDQNVWHLRVRARNYVTKNTLDHPYHLVGLPKT